MAIFPVLVRKCQHSQPKQGASSLAFSVADQRGILSAEMG